MAKNPYRPGVGTRPPYLAGREQQIHRFQRLLDDYPEKRRNLRVTGLRGVGKTVLLKEYERMARRSDWVVIRRDWSTRLCDEADFATAIASYLQEAVEELSIKARVKSRIKAATKAVAQIQVQIAEGVTVSVQAGAEQSGSSVLEDRLRLALTQVGEIAQAQGRGVALLFDEAHSVYDRPAKRQFPLGSLLSAFVAAQDDDEHPLPVMLVLCGLPPLTGNIHAARSNAERLFRAEEIGNLSLTPQPPETLSAAAQALVRPESDISYAPGMAERIARYVDGYPYFIQWFGEALWDAADLESTTTISPQHYERERRAIQLSLDEEFFEPRFRDARQADQDTLRVAAALEGDRFTKADLDAATGRSSGALSQSLKRLIADNLLYRDDHGVYAYTAPMFGDFMRRRHPRLDGDHRIPSPSMRVTPCRLPDLTVIEPAVHGDERGFFTETYRRVWHESAGISDAQEFIQDNHSRSSYGVVRGMHFHIGAGVAKLVRCARGRIIDVAVDLRRGSPTYGQWEGVELDGESLRELYVPVGFAHGFCVLSDVADVLYKQTAYYAPAVERGIAWNDPDIGIEWPLPAAELIVSARDAAAPRLRDLVDELPFVYGGA